MGFAALFTFMLFAMMGSMMFVQLLRAIRPLEFLPFTGNPHQGHKQQGK